MTDMQAGGAQQPSPEIRAALDAGLIAARSKTDRLSMPFPGDKVDEFSFLILNELDKIDIPQFPDIFDSPPISEWAAELAMFESLVSEGIRRGSGMPPLSSDITAGFIREILREIFEWFRD